MRLRRLRMQRRWLRLLLPMVLAAMLAGMAAVASGCGQQEAERLKSYGNDGYMGQSNSNPLLPRTGTAWSYEEDRRFASQLLGGLKGIQSANIAMNGEDMNVTLRLQQALSREEAAQLTAKAKRMLADNFPRYDVNVKSEQ